MSQVEAKAALASLTDEEAQLLNNSPDLLERFKTKYGLNIPPPPTQTPLQQFGTDLAISNGVLGTANTLLKAPEKMSTQGLNMIAQAVTPNQEVTGNLPRDIAMNTPRIAAETLAKVAPRFIDKGQILTMGAVKALGPALSLIKSAGPSIAKGAEAISGLEYKTPGVLTEAFNDPTLRSAPFKKSASSLYEAAKNELPNIVQESAGMDPFRGMIDNADIAKKAQQMINDGEPLLPAQAFKARKAAAAIKNSNAINKDNILNLIDKLDEVAKGSENIKMADPIYARGAKAEALNNILPQNKSGGTSIAKTILGSLKGIAMVGAMSPKVQGLVATGAGQAARTVGPALTAIANNPVVTAGAIKAAKMITDNPPFQINAQKAGVVPDFQLKPAVAELMKGRKVEAKSLPNPVIAPAALTLTADKAKEFLKLAKGDRNKARKMAQDKGYVIPQTQ